MKQAALLRRCRREGHLILLAVGFLTRIPIPAGVPFSETALNRCCRYFSLVGWLLGGIQALLLLAAHSLFPLALAVLLVLAASLLLTGAFHEDGLADTFDGLGGGQSVSRKLDIMKDSRIGTYGAAALCLGLLLRWQALVALGADAPLALFLTAALSRAFATALMGFLPYVSADRLSKSKPLVTRSDPIDLAVTVLIAVLPALFMAPLAVLCCVAALLIFGVWLAGFYRRSLGGYTGDLLGAAQQGAEVACYLTLLVCGFVP